MRANMLYALLFCLLIFTPSSPLTADNISCPPKTELSNTVAFVIYGQLHIRDITFPNGKEAVIDMLDTGYKMVVKKQGKRWITELYHVNTGRYEDI